MDIEKYRKMFLNEAGEHLQKMAEQLIAIETDPGDREGIDVLFRQAHSIKGMAATMGYVATTQLAHHLEDQLSDCRDQGVIATELIDLLLEGVELLEGLLEDIANRQPERDVSGFISGQAVLPQRERHPEETPAEPLTGPQELQISLRLTDSVAAPGPRMLVLLKHLAGFGTLLDAQPSEEKILLGESGRQLRARLLTELSQDEIFQQLQTYSELAEIDFPRESEPERKTSQKNPTVATTVRVDTDLLDRFINLTGELITNRYALQSAAGEKNWRELNEGLGQLARLVKNLHHQVLQVRMMPLETVTGRLPLTVRELCRNSGKEVQFAVEGGAIELDRAILEELTDPLTHMLRNAIDHGIEQSGRVVVKAWRERDQVLVQVADNGRGIDPEKIRQRAIERGLISPGQAQVLRDYDALQLICLPGFSTAEQVTESSGRGVGMDVVKSAVEKLGGVLLIESIPGEGTQMTMKLPLSVAIIRVLKIECAGSLLGIPITRVLQTAEVASDEVQTSGKQLVISLHGELLPLLSLRKILHQPKGAALNPLPLVVTEVFGRKIGLVVDRLVGQQEVFVQALPEPFNRLAGNNGGAILGDGRILFLLDVQSMLEKRRSKEA